MKTSLIIVAHPSSKGFSRKIAQKYKDEFSGNAEILDLYDERWQQPFLAFEDMHEYPENETRKKIQEKIQKADELVFIFPLWWGYMPAILKNFIDQNITAGFAYKYENGKPVGLLSEKTAKIFITCDGPKWMYALLLFPFFTILKTITLRFCGIHVTATRLYDQKRKRTPEQLEAWLQDVKKLAQQ